MNTVIIYYSKTGFTKRYAEWLAEEVAANLVCFDDAGKIDWAKYDTVVFASWFHAGTVQKLNWFKQQATGNAHKIVLTVGAMPAGAQAIEETLQNNFKEDRTAYKVFYLPGGLCYEKMKGPDKLMMKMFSGMMKKKKDKSPEEEEMANHLGSSYDLSKKDYLQPVITYIKGL